LIFVGDATMSPYELTYAGGSVEHWNRETGMEWLGRLLNAYPNAIWINPQPQEQWDYIHSIQLIRDIMMDRMYPLTLEGLERGMKQLSE
ncbi:MAG: hypothetical protein OQL28_07360, partial [Sedimenticola sp.]|nr:hypothetical protein [Sedimenticola sp.]